MANYELLGLNESTPQAVAPTASDTAVLVAALNASAGVYLGGTATANLLASYNKTTYTPALTFGGASVGITYNSQLGWYSNIGGRVFGEVFISLSSKGSSTGSAQITLPVSANVDSSYRAAPSVSYEDVTVTNYARSVIVGADPLVINLQEITNAGVVTPLTNADFTNSSVVIISFSYIT